MQRCIIFDASGASFMYGDDMHLKQGECPKCEDRGDSHGLQCIVRKLIFERDFKGRNKRYVTREEAMNRAVAAVEQFIEREKERKKMSETKNEVVVKPSRKLDFSGIDNHMVNADINVMNQDQIASYIRKLCEFVAINPITRPFDIIPGQGGKKLLYANKGCAEQLRNIWGISIRIVKREVVEGVYVVTAAAQMPDGRVDESTGCVWIDGVKGEQRANAMMKAETKAKRRVTLSICGLNMPDESEIESIPGVRKSQQPETPKALTQPQLARLFAIAKTAGIASKEELKEKLQIDKPLTDLTPDEYMDVCERLLLLASKPEPTPVTVEVQPAPVVIKKETQPEEMPWDKYLVK